MTVTYESHRGWSSGSHPAWCLEDKFEVVKDIGDGSFGSVQLAKTRGAGAHVVRKGTLVAIKTMKKTFDHFSQCMELREVVFLKSLPNHPHLVPAYDIFLDPLSKKLHIAMEYMDGNLYQLMKARDHKPLDVNSVKSILFQILGGLEHIHDHHFFHRDIKPENILVSASGQENGHPFKRYSSLVTPPSTPPQYTIKLADFGLARETQSRVPYTTYVSTRWYRAPEVLLRAGEYSAPVDIWALGAMAVEVATLRPLFPGGNEVDQVWRVCEIMGSPGSWVNKHGQKVGGGEWKDGVKLAQKLGFSFPKMAPHSLESVLPQPHWPSSLAHFVTWCLMWDPKQRPTSRQALQHEFFTDAVDPLRPKSSSTSRFLSRKASSVGTDSPDSGHGLTTKGSSWFRKSIPARENLAPAVPEHAQAPQAPQAPQAAAERPPVAHSSTTDATPQPQKARPTNAKRSTWTNGANGNANAAPIPILPSIRPVSPLKDEVNAQAKTAKQQEQADQHKKVGRQLSLNSQGNHYADVHRQEAERLLNGSGMQSPTGSQKESFFSHLRKRARRLSGRNQVPTSPTQEDVEANPDCTPWNGQKPQEPQSIAPSAADPSTDPNFAQLDRALNNVRYSLDAAVQACNSQPQKQPAKASSTSSLKRHHSMPYSAENKVSPAPTGNAPISSRTRRSVKHTNSNNRYETPDEEDELLDEALASAHKAARTLDDAPANAPADSNAAAHQANQEVPQQQHVRHPAGYNAPYLTPSPSGDKNDVTFGQQPNYTPSKPMNIPQQAPQQKGQPNPQWPTPPYDENDWAAGVAASIFATQEAYR